MVISVQLLYIAQLQSIQTIIAMLIEGKVAELSCMSDEFCKYFDALMCNLCNRMQVRSIFQVTELTFQGFEATFKALDASVKGFDDKTQQRAI